MEVYAHTHTPRKWTHYLWEFLMSRFSPCHAFVGLPVRLPLFGLVTSNPSQANKLRIFKSEQQPKQ
jgi:hypothetical protein